MKPLPLVARVSALLLTLIKVWLVSQQTLSAWAFAGHDDQLFVLLAASIRAGHWLGAYTNLTLAKGPVYPLWIALSSATGLSLLLTQELLYITACALAVIALRPLIANEYLLVGGYGLLLFNPVTWAIHRVIREGIYPALTVLVFACLIGLWLRRMSSPPRVAAWAVGLGAALGAFWLTREEGLWLIPPVILIVGAACATALPTWRRQPTVALARLGLFLLPFAVWGAVIAAVATVNLREYGVFTTVEFRPGPFVDAYGALTRVEPAQQQRFVPVPRETRERIYAASPAFRELRPALEEGSVGRGWAGTSCSSIPATCGEIDAAFFMWALRDAVAELGYYRTAPDAAAYYARLANEINAACDSGALRCGPRRASMSPPWRGEDLPLLLGTLRRAAFYLLTLRDVPPPTLASAGPEPMLAMFRDVTHARLTAGAPLLQVTGWAFSPTTDLRLAVDTESGTPAQMTLEWAPSPDVRSHYLATQGRDIANAQRARLTLLTACTVRCTLVAEGGGQQLGAVHLDGTAQAMSTPDLQLFVESESLVPATTTDTYALATSHVVPAEGVAARGLGLIARSYRAITPLLTVVAVLAYLFGWLSFLRNREGDVVLVTTALAGAIGARLLLLSLIDVTSFPAVGLLYLSAVYPLLFMFCFVTIANASSTWRSLVPRLLRPPVWIRARHQARMRAARGSRPVSQP